MLNREKELEADLNAVIEYRLEFYQTCEDKVRAQFQQKLDTLQEDLKRAQKQLQVMASENSDQKAMANKSQTETTRLNTQFEEATTRIETLEKDNAKQARKIETLEKNLQDQIQEGKKDQAELKRLRHMEPDKKVKQAAQAQKEAKDLKKQLTESARLARTRKSEMDSLKKELEQAQEKIKELEKQASEETEAA
ncbi:hypothetical protein [Parendozoicomonas haliclonae]|uniref:Uncharacterized protein n=1 Tax=Parendozoicomonas haliclonae TaxID=1960125 RepID=A0A1X7ARK1_9GAMM|nr:hypothetical protein [Parendozoicomonas haliclonae]SMA50772.1 hypothetical protein EHSB41UT_04589 [Parendozoicomonas haliclonae]